MVTVTDPVNQPDVGSAGSTTLSSSAGGKGGGGSGGTFNSPKFRALLVA